MTERARVEKLEGKLVTVSLEMNEGCESCANGSCKTRRGHIEAWNSRGIELSEGDFVEVVIRGRDQAKGAAWVLGLPLAGLFAGYAVGRAAFPGPGEGPAVACAGGLFALFLCVGMLVQRGRKTDSMPHIEAKLDGLDDARTPDEPGVTRKQGTPD